ncbi:protein PALE CRESS, chloroplastic isoform X2 [Phragmites australis]|uniref:protein PALE CRESS, chloroplastic isoform X2 n=1 Tax=Phragmites australis TaxID=29695 RepID=UPI002D771CA8|nr:protein PALE CRESS, chloroplastic isoform X2 [Phragmites australis]
MAAAALALSTFLRPRPVSPFLPSPDSAPHVRGPRRPTPSRLSPLRLPRPLLSISAVEKTKAAAGASEEGELEGMPPEFYDEEWQAGQRERTKEWHTYRQKEEAEEEKRTNEYREIGMRLKAYPQEEVCKARILVSIFIRAGEDVEEEIEKAAERGELTELVLMVIWNRLDVARRDDERDVIRSLDLLYRRVEHEGRIELPPQDDDVLLRVDFVREVDELLKEVKVEQEKNKLQTGYDPESVVTMLKQQEKLQAIRQVESLLELASSLKW